MSGGPCLHRGRSRRIGEDERRVRGGESEVEAVVEALPYLLPNSYSPPDASALLYIVDRHQEQLMA